MAKTYSFILRQIALPAGADESLLAAKAAARLGCPPEAILDCTVIRRSLDARKRRGKAMRIYHVRIEVPVKWRKKIKRSGLDIVPDAAVHSPPSGESAHFPPPAGRPRPVVVGAGPAGLFAALRLAKARWKPILIERGDELGERRRRAAAFWRDGVLDRESNVLYGLGGAGLFSDGKLNTRHKDRSGLAAILAMLVAAGAPESILIDAEPHVGSDLLGDVVERLAAEIVHAGGEIRQRTRLDRLLADNGTLRAIVATGPSGSAELPAPACVLAAGHSARDIHFILHESGVAVEAKPFAVGLRVEMPQEQVDESQRAKSFRPKRGEAASFRMSRAPTNGAAACYTFCMCPGGLVIPCATEPGCLAVNGMSYHARAGEWANAAFLTPVTPAMFDAFAGETPLPLAGLAFQRFWEEKAFLAGLPGGGYAVPASRLADFMAGRPGELPARRSVHRAASANLRAILPEELGATLAAAIPAMLARLAKVDADAVVLYGVESRTSSPVRIRRGDDGMAAGLDGLFPAGEGSGYAGGIMTSALDGWKAAEKLMRHAAETSAL